MAYVQIDREWAYLLHLPDLELERVDDRIRDLAILVENRVLATIETAVEDLSC
jgi:hypothetical protein